jgi:amidase
MALPATDFTAPLERTFSGTRVAFSEDLGLFPVEPEVREVCRSAIPIFEVLGCVVEQAHPDFRGADETFQVLRAAMFAERLAPLLEASRELIKDTVVWNVEKGLALSPESIARAQDHRRALIVRIDAFLEEHAFLCLPVSQVAPFPVEVEWPHEVAGVEMHTYLDWMMTCAVITLTGLPAISVPAGFTAEGLPVGLQIVGRRNADFEVLQLAHAFEQATRFGERQPVVCSGIE